MAWQPQKGAAHPTLMVKQPPADFGLDGMMTSTRQNSQQQPSMRSVSSQPVSGTPSFRAGASSERLRRRPHETRAVASQSTIEGLDAVVNARQLVSFTIVARDAFDSPLSSGGDPFVVGVRGPSHAHARVTDTGDGRYAVEFKLSTSGTYSVCVSLHGAKVAGSPIALFVQRPQPSAPHCVLQSVQAQASCMPPVQAQAQASSYAHMHASGAKPDAHLVVQAREPTRLTIAFRDAFGQPTHSEEVDCWVVWDPIWDESASALGGVGGAASISSSGPLPTVTPVAPMLRSCFQLPRPTPSQPTRAALRIQSIFRGILCRRHQAAILRLAKRIQACARGRAVRRTQALARPAPVTAPTRGLVEMAEALKKDLPQILPQKEKRTEKRARGGVGRRTPSAEKATKKAAADKLAAEKAAADKVAAEKASAEEAERVAAEKATVDKVAVDKATPAQGDEAALHAQRRHSIRNGARRRSSTECYFRFGSRSRRRVPLRSIAHNIAHSATRRAAQGDRNPLRNRSPRAAAVLPRTS